jgi:hypothetical protein
MADGLSVDIDEIRAHARNIEKLRARFAAVKAASAHIAQDDQAYGLLCGWIAAILESRHTRQDELIAYVEENLSLVGDGLRKTIEAYETVEGDTAGLISKVGSPLTP